MCNTSNRRRANKCCTILPLKESSKWKVFEINRLVNPGKDSLYFFSMSGKLLTTEQTQFSSLEIKSFVQSRYCFRILKLLL